MDNFRPHARWEGFDMVGYRFQGLSSRLCTSWFSISLEPLEYPSVEFISDPCRESLLKVKLGFGGNFTVRDRQGAKVNSSQGALGFFGLMSLENPLKDLKSSPSSAVKSSGDNPTPRKAQH
jgi:hypothetical protein